MTVIDFKVLNDYLIKQEITEQMYKYCRGMDRIDNDLAAQVFHKKALLDFGEIFNGEIEDFLEWVSKLHKTSFLSHSHQILNILVEIDGDRAASESYFTVCLRFESEGKVKEQTLRGRYLDLWSNHKNRWAIDQRLVISEFDHTKETTVSSFPSIAKRDKTDPSYDLLSKFKISK